MKHPNQTAEPLSITIDPGTVYISTGYPNYVNLAVTIQNVSSATVQATGVAITLPDTLTPYNSLGSISPVAAQSDLWTFTPSGMTTGEFDAAPANSDSVSLQANDQWQFTLQNVTLVTQITQQPVNVIALVAFADGTSQTQPLVVNMESTTAAIVSFQALPAIINPGETSVLSWQCTGIDYVIIEGLDDTHRNPSGTVDVSPNASTNYTLYAYGAGVILSSQQYVSVGNADIIRFGGYEGLSSVDYGQMIELVWTCNVFTMSITLTDDSDVEIPDLLTGNNTPQGGSVTVGPIIKPTRFIFTAYGNTESNFNQSEPTIDINDVTYQLCASPDSGIWEKDNVTLSWNISSASAVSIDPFVPNGPSLQNLAGSVIINPEADVTYTLSVSGFTGNQPAQYQDHVPLSVEQVSITSFTQNPAQITPDTGTNACTLNWSTNAQVVTISEIGNVDPNSSQPLTAPPNGTVYTLAAGTIQNPGILTLPLTIINGYGPFTFNNFQIDQSCSVGLDLAVTDPLAMQYLNPGIEGGYAAVLTGVTATCNPAPPGLGVLCMTATANPYFMIFIWPETSEPLTLEWTNSGDQSGTIMLQTLTEEHLAAREAHARLRRIKAKKD